MKVGPDDGMLVRQDVRVADSLLRILTCGSVDDGKSTLIGRLLYDTQLVPDDQLNELERDTKKHGSTGGDNHLDFALLVDGLEAEREQGITIDVAYRFFLTPKRKFIIADTPGHEEYTRNMATGASNAEVAIVLIDARKGVLRQTRRHTFIASLLGIRHVVVAVNKMDLIRFDQDRFEAICTDFKTFSETLGFQTVDFVPMSALQGDNVVAGSLNMAWHPGKSLLSHLESTETDTDRVSQPFRLPIQLVIRPHQDFRGFSGQIAAGRVSVGDRVVIAKSGQASRVKSIICGQEMVETAVDGKAVTIVLEDDLELSRGNMLVAPDNRPHFADQFMAHVVWFDKEPMIPGRNYICRTEADSVGATITTLKFVIDIHTFAQKAATALQMNEVGVCNVSTQAPILFDSYRTNRNTGNFVLIDRTTNATVGAGMIDHPLRRADNIQWQAIDIDKRARAALKLQTPVVLWFTGLSGSGKSTIANLVEKLLHARGKHTYMLDGDNIRHGLNRDLGFSKEARVENIRRAAEVAKLMADAGLIVIVSFISPFRSERTMARELFDKGEFIEVFVDTPIDECARRDPKGLYRKALVGEIENFTGISSPYERPTSPEIHLKTIGHDPLELAMLVEKFLDDNDPA